MVAPDRTSPFAKKYICGWIEETAKKNLSRPPCFLPQPFWRRPQTMLPGIPLVGRLSSFRGGTEHPNAPPPRKRGGLSPTDDEGGGEEGEGRGVVGHPRTTARENGGRKRRGGGGGRCQAQIPISSGRVSPPEGVVGSSHPPLPPSSLFCSFGEYPPTSSLSLARSYQVQAHSPPLPSPPKTSSCVIRTKFPPFGLSI